MKKITFLLFILFSLTSFARIELPIESNITKIDLSGENINLAVLPYEGNVFKIIPTLNTHEDRVKFKIINNTINIEINKDSNEEGGAWSWSGSFSSSSSSTSSASSSASSYSEDPLDFKILVPSNKFFQYKFYFLDSDVEIQDLNGSLNLESDQSTIKINDFKGSISSKIYDGDMFLNKG